jgi:hypothetical protein
MDILAIVYSFKFARTLKCFLINEVQWNLFVQLPRWLSYVGQSERLKGKITAATGIIFYEWIMT